MTDRSHRGPRWLVRHRWKVVAGASVTVAGLTAVVGGLSVAEESDKVPVWQGYGEPDDCPVFGDRITASFLTAHGLEVPRLPEGLVESATARAVTCRWSGEDMEALEIHLTGPHESIDRWSSILIGEEHGARTPSDQADLLDSIENGPAAHDEPKPSLVRVAAGDNSIVAIDPRSSLAQLANAPSGLDTIEELRWS